MWLDSKCLSTCTSSTRQQHISSHSFHLFLYLSISSYLSFSSYLLLSLLISLSLFLFLDPILARSISSSLFLPYLFLSILVCFSSYHSLSLLVTFNFFFSLSVSSYHFVSLVVLFVLSWLVTLKGFEPVPRLPIGLALALGWQKPRQLRTNALRNITERIRKPSWYTPAVVLRTWARNCWLMLVASQIDRNPWISIVCWCLLSCFSLRFGRSIWHRHHSLKVYWFETQAGIMSTFRNCSACICMLSHWTSVAESFWDVDRAVRACIETTRSIALVGNSSVACQEATHQLKLWQTLAWPLTMFISFPIGMSVAGTLSKSQQIQRTNLQWHHH